MPEIVPDRNVLTITEVAAILRCSKTHVSHLLNGKVPGVPKLTHVALGRRKVVHKDWLSEWMEARKSQWSALDAGIGGFYASKTLSKGQRTRAQTRPPQGMGGAMVGARRTAFEGPRTLLGNYKKPGRCAHGFYSSAIERRRRTAAGSSLYVRRLSGQSLPPVVSAEVEGVDPHDHGSDN